MKQQIKATIIADSINPEGVRITTMEWVYPRFIHGEVMTHRVFSRNAMSSRAVPVKKMLAQVLRDPAMPVHWGRNQPGMQAKAELTGLRRLAARGLWRLGSFAAVAVAGLMHLAGVHKQLANRVLEPWQWMHTLVTSTEWDNFFELRAHEDAQPEFYALAKRVRTEMEISAPKLLQIGEWHLPFVTDADNDDVTEINLAQISAARCARVSYLTHDGQFPSRVKDLALFDRLAGSKPFHASPLEHQAQADVATYRSGNLRGWAQFRKVWESMNVGK